MSIRIHYNELRTWNNEIGVYCDDILPEHIQSNLKAMGFVNSFTCSTTASRDYIVGLMEYISFLLKAMENDIYSQVNETRTYVNDMISATGGDPYEGLR